MMSISNPAHPLNPLNPLNPASPVNVYDNSSTSDAPLSHAETVAFACIFGSVIIVIVVLVIWIFFFDD